MISKDDKDGFPNLIIMSTMKFNVANTLEKIMTHGTDLKGVPVKLYRIPSLKRFPFFSSSKNKNPFLIMNPVIKLEELITKASTLRRLMTVFKKNPECQNCASDQQANLSLAKMVSNNSFLLGHQ